MATAKKKVATKKKASEPRGGKFTTASAYAFIPVYFTTAVSQTAKRVFRFTPGYKFEIVKIATHCDTKAGTVTGNVLIGATSVLNTAAAFTAGAEVSASVKNGNPRRGTPAQQLFVEYTTDGTGALTHPYIIIVIKAL